MTKLIHKLFGFLVVGLVAVYALPATALTTGGIGAYPAHPDPTIKYSESWFIYSLDLGESKEDAVLLSNTTPEAQTIKLYPVDAVPSNQGNFALEAESDPRDGIGAWIELSETLVTLEPGEQREIPFTITIPETADVGEHAGGIILQKAKAGEVEGNMGASIVTRIGVRVYETVPGEIRKNLVLTNFAVQRVAAPKSAPFYHITLTAINQSNVTLKPEVRLKIGGWGKTTYADLEDITIKSLRLFFTRQGKFPIKFFHGDILKKEWQLMRDQKVTTRWEWPEPKFGRFTFQAALTYEGNDGPKMLTSPALTVWVIPWRELGVVGGTIVVIGALEILRRILRSKKRWQKYTVKKGEQLVEIAEGYGMSWKKIARANQLKSPLVREGQTILVPPPRQARSEPGKTAAKPKKNSTPERNT